MQTPTTMSRKSGLKWIFGLAVLSLLVFALYLAFVMNWTYSGGERAGFSHKAGFEKPARVSWP